MYRTLVETSDNAWLSDFTLGCMSCHLQCWWGFPWSDTHCYHNSRRIQWQSGCLLCIDWKKVKQKTWMLCKQVRLKKHGAISYCLWTWGYWARSQISQVSILCCIAFHL